MLSVADGRELEVELGPPGERTLLYHVGTPCAGRLFDSHVRQAAARGLRMVTYSRPGYGASTRREGRVVADCAEDVSAIADALEVSELLVAGVSGGGPHALACAALLPGLVPAVATIGSVAPFKAHGLDWLAGMGQENLAEFEAMRSGGEELRAYLEAESAAMTATGAAELRAALGDLLSDVDRRALTGDYAEHLAEAFGAAVERGIWGWFDDDIACLHDWGFDLPSIEVPVTIWQGAQDRFVPAAHGEWLGAHITIAHLRLLPDQGHLSLELGAFGEVLDELLAKVLV